MTAKDAEEAKAEQKTSPLWRAVVERTKHARACGALAPIETEQEIIEDGGVRFVVRRVSSLARKAEDRGAAVQPSPSDGRRRVFPLDPDLVVADVSDTHVAVLNKFPVIAYHLLLVTREYAEQDALLDRSDCDALAACMQEYDALGFYNGGSEAGASQRHKHLQLIPLPLAVDDALPMNALFESVRGAKGVLKVPGLPFRHAFSWCEGVPRVTSEKLLHTYRSLLAAVGIEGVRDNGTTKQSAPYNMLATRDWMILVPRSRAFFEGVSINAVAYAGSMFVKTDAELNALRRSGPMAALAAVAAIGSRLGQ